MTELERRERKPVGTALSNRRGRRRSGITGLLSVGSNPSKDVLPNILGWKEIFMMAKNSHSSSGCTLATTTGREAVVELRQGREVGVGCCWPRELQFMLFL